MKDKAGDGRDVHSRASKLGEGELRDHKDSVTDGTLGAQVKLWAQGQQETALRSSGCFPSKLELHLLPEFSLT